MYIKSDKTNRKNIIIESIKKSPILQPINIIGIIFNLYILIFVNIHFLPVISLTSFSISFALSIAAIKTKGWFMAILRSELIPKKTYWVMKKPTLDTFHIPTVKMIDRFFIAEGIKEIRGLGSYMYSVIFDDSLKLDVYDSGLKSGQRIILDYFVERSLKDLVYTLIKIMTFETNKTKYNFELIQEYINQITESNPELLI